MVMHYRKQSTKHMETITVYKLFRQEADGLHPLFIDRDMVLPIGEWLDARAPTEEATIFLTSGFAMVNTKTQGIVALQGKRPTRLQIKVANKYGHRWIEAVQGRYGKHIYDFGIGSDGQVLRFTHRPGWHSSAAPSLPAVDMTGKVWAECLIPAADYYTVHRNVSGLSRTHEPIDWYISQKIFIVRLVDSPQINHVESAK